MPPDRWLEVTVRSAVDSGLVTSVLFDLGATAVEEREGGLVTHFPAPPDLEEALEAIRSRLQPFDPKNQQDLSWRWRPQEAWEILWREGLGPRKITPRITVAPSWEPVEAGEGEFVLVLDPGMAFGTAEHATTRGCLRALDGLVSEGDQVADVGSGSGILSIATVFLGASRVLAVEMDSMSCETAQENVERNGVETSIDILQMEVDGDRPLQGSPYHGIVANLQSHLVMPLLSALRDSLRPGGWLVVSGILTDQVAEVEAAATERGFRLEGTDVEEDWWTGTFRRIGPEPS